MYSMSYDPNERVYTAVSVDNLFHDFSSSFL